MLRLVLNSSTGLSSKRQWRGNSPFKRAMSNVCCELGRLHKFTCTVCTCSQWLCTYMYICTCVLYIVQSFITTCLESLLAKMSLCCFVFM